MYSHGHISNALSLGHRSFGGARTACGKAAMPDLPHADAAAACCCRCRLPGARLAPLQDVRVWMEGIIERSKERAGVHSHLVTDAVPADPNQIQLPKFVGHRWAGWGRAGWGGVGGRVQGP